MVWQNSQINLLLTSNESGSNDPNSPVGVHNATELAKAGEGQPEDVVDVAQHVHQGDGNRDAEDVEVELGRLAGALVVEAVHIADHRVGGLEDGQPLPSQNGPRYGSHLGYFDPDFCQVTRRRAPPSAKRRRRRPRPRPFL